MGFVSCSFTVVRGFPGENSAAGNIKGISWHSAGNSMIYEDDNRFSNVGRDNLCSFALHGQYVVFFAHFAITLGRIPK